MTMAELNLLLHTLCEDDYPEDGILHGSPAGEVRGVLIAWMASPGVLAHAGEAGLNAVICHENFMFTSYGREAKLNTPAEIAAWPANARRLELAQRHALTIIRCHRTLDAWCVPDVWCRDILGLGEPVVAQGHKGYRSVQVYEIATTPAAQVVANFKQQLGLATVRAWLRDPERPIRRIGTAWGGVGLFANFFTTAQTLAAGVDMMVGGETDECAAYFFAEAGADFVELGHQRSEIEGIARLAPWLQERLDVPVAVHRENTPLAFL